MEVEVKKSKFSIRYTSIQQVIDKLSERNLLTVLEFAPPDFDYRGRVITKVICKCTCGVVRSYTVHNMVNGSTLSCGCLHRKIIREQFLKYPNSNKHILVSYRCMMKRCYLKTDQAYKLYGGNGVSVCKEWIDDYYSFEKWSLDNGWAKGLVIDKDILGNGKLYSPEMCKWATQKENSQYKVNSRKFFYNGQLLTLSAICEIKGVKRATIDTRIRLGMGFEEAINSPIKDKNLNLKHIKK